MTPLHHVKKYGGMCIRLDTYTHTGRTDGRTDRNGKAISRSACNACWRAKNNDAYSCNVLFH